MLVAHYQRATLTGAPPGVEPLRKPHGKSRLLWPIELRRQSRIAVGDGGIGPPVLERAPVLQTGPRDHPHVTDVGSGADGETRTPTYTGSRPAAFTAFATSANSGPSRRARELFSEVVIARGTVKSRHCPYSTA